MKTYPPDDVFWRRKYVLEITAQTSVTLWRREKEGKFPAAIKTGPRCVRYRKSEVLNWMASLDRTQQLAPAA